MRFACVCVVIVLLQQLGPAKEIPENAERSSASPTNTAAAQGDGGRTRTAASEEEDNEQQVEKSQENAVSPDERAAGKTFQGDLEAAMKALDDAKVKILEMLEAQIEISLRQKEAIEKWRSRTDEKEYFVKTGFVPASSPIAKKLRERQRLADQTFRRTLTKLAREFPAHRDEALEQLAEFNTKRRVNLTGTWLVKYPEHTASRPYTFRDDGETVLISSNGHPPTGLINSSGELKWDEDHEKCSGNVEEQHSASRKIVRGTLGVEVLDPRTLEVSDWLFYDTRPNKRIVLRYYRQE